MWGWEGPRSCWGSDWHTEVQQGRVGGHVSLPHKTLHCKKKMFHCIWLPFDSWCSVTLMTNRHSFTICKFIFGSVLTFHHLLITHSNIHPTTDFSFRCVFGWRDNWLCVESKPDIYYLMIMMCIFLTEKSSSSSCSCFSWRFRSCACTVILTRVRERRPVRSTPW